MKVTGLFTLEVVSSWSVVEVTGRANLKHVSSRSITKATVFTGVTPLLERRMSPFSPCSGLFLLCFPFIFGCRFGVKSHLDKDNGHVLIRLWLFLLSIMTIKAGAAQVAP